MSDIYFTRVGASRRRTPAPSLYALPTRERRDDDRVILHVGDLMPVCADCGRGHLQWAEAGYVPWHRICDTCGSHWDLHPLGMGIAYVPIEVPDTTRSYWWQCDVCKGIGIYEQESCWECEGKGCGYHTQTLTTRVEVRPSTWVDFAGWVPIDPTWPVRQAVPATRALVIDRGEPRQNDPTWGDLLARVTEEHLAAARAEQDRTLSVPCVPACWARRARFYRR